MEGKDLIIINSDELEKLNRVKVVMGKWERKKY